MGGVNIYYNFVKIKILNKSHLANIPPFIKKLVLLSQFDTKSTLL